MTRRRRTLLGLAGFACVACESSRPAPETPSDGGAEVRALSESLPLQPADLDSLIHGGDSAYADAEYTTAQALWRTAIVQARSERDTVREARLLTSLGLAAWHLGEYDEARASGERALELKLRAGLHADLFRSYNALGLLANDESRLSDAIESYRSASEAARAQGDEASLGKVANNLGLVQFALGQFSEARAGFREARDIGRKLGDPLIEGRALSNLGMVGAQLGDPRAALLALAEARELMVSVGDRAGEQHLLGQMGSAYDALGEPRLALAAMDSALDLSRKYGLRQEEASNLELIAGLHRQAGDLQRALDLYVQANRINRELGLTIEEGTNLQSVAEIHVALGRSDLARENANAALRLHRATDARLAELRDLVLLAEIASTDRGADSVADGHLRAADRLTAVLRTRVARVDVALTRAAIADRRKDSREVFRVLRGARNDLALGGFDGAWRSAALRARAYARIGMFDSAALAGREAVTALERVRAELGSSFFRTAFAADKAAPYADLVDILLRLDRTAEAFEVADGARSRALVEHLATASEEATPRATVRSLTEGEALLRRIGKLVSLRDSLEETSIADRDRSAQVQSATLAADLAEARGAYEALLAQVTHRDTTGTALLGGRQAKVAEVQGALRPNEALLEYFVTSTRLITFVLTARAVRAVTTDVPIDDLANRVRLARDLIGQSSSNADIEVLGALHGLLIAPAERAGLLEGVKRLVIVPHSVLSYLPFAALRREGAPRFLIEDYSLLHLPSAAALAVVRSSAMAAPMPSRAGAFAPFSRTLPGSVREVRAFQRAVTEADRITGKRATEWALRKALSGGGIVHLATHGVMNPRNPMFSRLELSGGTGRPEDDGRLEVHELLALRIASPLVFLSGCETGVGAAWSTQFARGEDYATLAQAFLYAGARTVAATLWQIGDEGAAAFAERFYIHLRTVPPDEALARAQRELLRGARYSSPFYWAGYQVIGESALLPETQLCARPRT